jgi:uncharacterized iron-regulated membrane protein
MRETLDHVKLLSMNVGSWAATVGSVAVAKDVIQIMCLVASLAVSGYSIWWIRKQAKALDAKNKEKQEGPIQPK